MIDVIQAIRGQKSCGWCSLKPNNWLENRYGGYEENTLFGDIVWWVYNHGSLGTWRIARWWHYQFHAAPSQESPCDCFEEGVL